MEIYDKELIHAVKRPLRIRVYLGERFDNKLQCAMTEHTFMLATHWHYSEPERKNGQHGFIQTRRFIGSYVDGSSWNLSETDYCVPLKDCSIKGTPISVQKRPYYGPRMALAIYSESEKQAIEERRNQQRNEANKKARKSASK